MKAAVVRRFAPFEEVAVEEVPDPVPGKGEVVIDMVAAEINFPDLLVIEGKYQFKPPLPFSPGKAGTGRVAAIGPGVTDLEVGDRVAVQVEYGAYTEKLRARAEHCCPIPERIDFATAAALGLTYQTAWFALKDRAQLSAGESVLVLGASGGVGVASVQLAKALGAIAIAGARGPEKIAFARRIGADHAIDLADHDLRDNLKAEVARITHGRGVDVVIDSVGGAPHAAALRALAWCGRLIIVGFTSDEIPTIRANYLLLKNIAVLGLQWSDYRDRTPGKMIEAQRAIFELYLAGKLAPHIEQRLPLADFKQGLRALRDGRALGKIILDIARK